MDLGFRVHGSESGHENRAATQGELGSGSGFDCEGYCRSSKMARTEDFSSGYKTLSFDQSGPLLSSTSLISSDPRRQEHMLNFCSSEKSEALDLIKDGCLDNKSSVSPYLQKFSSSYNGNTGMMKTSMHGNFTGLKGAFTLTQWAELEQQALIYKYIIANVPIPSTLLFSLKKSFYPYSPESLPPNSIGWGAFHLGISGSTMDPEPGRCRRTDGKKWRCSRDAVTDQKYCERHINRGRHRSRKPVEGRSGHTTAISATGSTISKLVTSSSNSLNIGFNHNPFTDSVTIRVQNSRGAKEFPSDDQKQENPLDFGFIASDSLVNPSQKSSYIDSAKGIESYLQSVPWPEELKSDWTQLSMSIPMASSDQEKLALSPLRLNREILEPVTKVKSWIHSMGGPLGEVLNNGTKMNGGSSPTGVLQKSTFCSLSNNGGHG